MYVRWGRGWAVYLELKKAIRMQFCPNLFGEFFKHLKVSHVCISQ